MTSRKNVPEKYLESREGEIYVFDWKELCLITRYCLTELSNTLFNTANNTDATVIKELGYSLPKHIIVKLNEQKTAGYLDIFPWRIPFYSIGGAFPRLMFDYIDSDSIYQAAKQRINNENSTDQIQDN